MWGPTALAAASRCKISISIHGPRVGADGGQWKIFSTVYISIHGPRVGADVRAKDSQNFRHDFNPRPPCGGRLQLQGAAVALIGFQSTAPVWGPTVAEDVQTGPAEISIHGPRVGADTGIKYTLDATGEFQSTAPVWGPTWGRGLGEMESSDFNPRPPCGGRHSTMMDTFSEKLFQSTAPVWGPTTGSCTPVPAHQFQSTAPVWGPTPAALWFCRGRAISIHGPRAGADHGRPDDTHKAQGFQSTAPVRGPTQPRLWGWRCEHHFNPRPPCGGRLHQRISYQQAYRFQSTAPVRGPTLFL